ncbi:MAG: CehA/McbA family metallohydrolase [Planctomycetaceae bacterium]|nr:CehA/McbA family metallohydrolase [Planctomycetaceae bacterium]
MAFISVCLLAGGLPWSGMRLQAGILQGIVVDAESGEAVASRVYLQNEQGEWLFVQSASSRGSALEYREQWVPMPDSVERHTTVSAEGFKVDLPAGRYRIEIEKGKEYLPLSDVIEIRDADVQREFLIRRYAHAAEQGWYSGETHVHRRIQELPNVMQAEDLNVAFPVTFWTTRSDQSPDLEPSTLRRQGPSPFGPREDRGASPIYLDRTHVILPRNTEYEIFSVGEQRHVLGAVFLLNHQSVFRQTAPPIRAIAEQAHAEGALLDLDKHSWPWALMLVPVAKVDLFELSNNSVWRTQFGFRSSLVPPADWMSVERDSAGALTEWGWLEFGFQFYYALLNCGFRMMPTAGTASGVHPVPLGHSRVYVQTGRDFSHETWLEGLRAGRSFVTTGPMLFAELDGQWPGHEFQRTRSDKQPQRLQFRVLSPNPVTSIEVLLNGRVVASLTPERSLSSDWWESQHEVSIAPDQSSWVAVRCVSEQADGRKRFAHTAPWFITVDEQPITPRRQEVQYFVERMQAEVERNQSVLSAAAMAEFQEALQTYESLLERAE